MNTSHERVYYIQIGKFKEENLPDHPVGIDDTYDLEYMGSSEFEFGALGKSVRFMHEHRADLKVKYIKELHIHLLHTFNDTALKSYVQQLILLHEGKLRPKERTRFEKDSDTFYKPKVNFWWDIRNGTMWTNRSDFAKKMLPALQASFKNKGLPE